MARLHQQPTITLEVVLVLSESEARALEAISGYSFESFLEFFYKNLGKHYLEPHEAGLRSLFQSAQRELRPIFDKKDRAHKAFLGKPDQ